MFWKGRIYVLDSATLWEEIIMKYHDFKLARHPGYTKTHKLITRNYWWPQILGDIKWYVAGCERCQANKPNQQPKRNHLHPNEIPSGPWEVISIDLIGPLPELAGHNSVLVIVDWFSKMACYIPINMNISAQGVAKTSWDWVFKNVGIPQKVINNWEPQFVSRFIKELCLQLGIERNPSTAYQPSDRQMERINQELEQYLCIYCNYKQDNWAEWLSIAEFSYNNRLHSSTGQSLFMINLGCYPNMGEDKKNAMKGSPGTEQFIKTIREIWAGVEAVLKRTNEMMKRKWDAGRKPEIERKKGDLVWIDAAHYNTDQPSKKLSAKWLGPFPIIRKVGKASYKLKILLTWKSIHPVVDESYLTSYVASAPEQQSQKSNNRISNPVGQETVQEVKEILNSRWRGGRLQYLIKWRGQPLEERTWESREELMKGAPRSYKEFHQNHPDAPRVPTILLPAKTYADIAKTRS